jgi:hypothetical protein
LPARNGRTPDAVQAGHGAHGHLRHAVGAESPKLPGKFFAVARQRIRGLFGQREPAVACGREHRAANIGHGLAQAAFERLDRHPRRQTDLPEHAVPNIRACHLSALPAP